VKRILRYLSHTKDMKLKLGDVNDQCNKRLIGFVDADWGGDPDDRKSNTGYLFKYLGAPISWSSKKQTLVTLSSTEAEYIALCEAGKEALWLSQVLKDFNEHVTELPVIYEDNQSCIKMIQSEKSCHQTKHIATKYHFIRDLYKQNDIAVKYCSSGK